jgi:hypothetical protein
MPSIPALPLRQKICPGYANISNTQFINLLYQNVLDRAPDASGLAGWLNLMASGTSREVVLVGFAESAENIAKTGADWLVAV